MNVEMNVVDMEAEQRSSRVLQEKIGILLQGNLNETGEVISHGPERKMAAWMLLVKLGEEELNAVFQAHGERLQGFVVELFSEKAYKRILRGRLFSNFLHLVSHILMQLDVSKIPLEFQNFLIRIWREFARMYPSTPEFLDTHCAFVQMIDGWMATNQDQKSCQVWLGHVWEIFAVLQSGDSGAVADESKEEEYAKEWAFMCEALQKSLGSQPDDNGDAKADDGDNADDDNNSDVEIVIEDSSHNQYVENIIVLLSRHWQRALTGSLAITILKWTVLNSSSRIKKPELRIVWHEWLLHSSQFFISSDEDFQKALAGDVRFTKCYNKLLMAQVISPDQSHHQLRALAWHTLVVTVTACGWGWMVAKTPSASKLGATGNLCTWIRLASGEWRIALQSLVGSNNSTSSSAENDVAPSGLSCAKLMVGIVNHLVQMQDKPESENFPFSFDAFLHLQKSLEGSLRTTVEYLKAYGADLTQQASQKDYFKASAQFFSIVLQEVDIWEKYSQETKSNAGQEQLSHGDVIDCLEYLLEESQDLRLMPGIVSILAGAEGSPSRVQTLSELWPSLVSFLEHAWQQDLKNCQLLYARDTILWACSCTEIWLAMDPNSKTTKRRISVCIVQCIQALLLAIDASEGKNDKAGMQKLVSSVVSCYMALEDDRVNPPKEHEKRVILRALQFCQDETA